MKEKQATLNAYKVIEKIIKKKIEDSYVYTWVSNEDFEEFLEWLVIKEPLIIEEFYEERDTNLRNELKNVRKVIKRINKEITNGNAECEKAQKV